jgi:hypothetical protein
MLHLRNIIQTRYEIYAMIATRYANVMFEGFCDKSECTRLEDISVTYQNDMKYLQMGHCYIVVTRKEKYGDTLLLRVLYIQAVIINFFPECLPVYPEYFSRF